MLLNKKDMPEEWSSFRDELDDAVGHLQRLIKELDEAGQVDETDFRIQLAHVYAHLNRAWYRRGLIGDIPESDFREAGGFPKDIDPV